MRSLLKRLLISIKTINRMLKEIIAVSGKPGLYKLMSQGANMSIVESLIDKKRIPVYARDKANTLGNVFIFTEGDEAPISEVFTAIKEKENGGKISFDFTKAQPDELRAYFAEVLPAFDRERVYPSDIKKMLKWYELLIDNGITDFSTKEEEETAEKDNEDVDSDAGGPEEKEAKKTVKAKAGTTTAKRKGILNALPSGRAAKVKSTPKTSTPKRSVVGAKRGS